MLGIRVGFIAVVLITLIGLLLFQCGFDATSKAGSATTGNAATQNKFVAVWHSHITYASGQRVSDGDLDISDVRPARTDRVSVLHSLRGGPVTGYTMFYPDRIEIQISLGNGRVAHYNGVMVSAYRIEGSFFVTQDQSRHHGRNPSVLTRTSGRFEEEDGIWIATQP